LSSDESTPQVVQRLPAESVIHGSECSDSESLVPRSNSTSSLGDYRDMTPRSIEGQAQMPGARMELDAVPWASERLHLETRCEDNAFPDAFKGTLGFFGDPCQPMVSGTMVSESADSCSPSKPTMVAYSLAYEFSSACQEEQDDNAQLSSDSEALVQTSILASLEDSEEDRARVHTRKARDLTQTLDGELRNIDSEMQELMQDLLNLKEHVATVRPHLIDN
jgi:hypothetical protein